MRSHRIKFIAFLLFIVFCCILGQSYHVDIPMLQDYFKQFPPIKAGLIFVFAYIASTTFLWFGPKDVLRIASALVFGGLQSSIFIYFGELGNAIVLFHLSRKLGREYIEDKFHLKEKQLKSVKGEAGVWGVMALRINALIPLRFQDLGYGLTNISFGKYFAGVVLATFPRVLIIQVVIAEIGDYILALQRGEDFPATVLRMVDHLSKEPTIMLACVIYVLAILLLTILAIIIKVINKRKLRKKNVEEK